VWTVPVGCDTRVILIGPHQRAGRWVRAEPYRSCAKTRRNARKASTISGCVWPRWSIPLRLLEGRKPNEFGGFDPSGDDHRETGPSGVGKPASWLSASAEAPVSKRSPAFDRPPEIRRKVGIQTRWSFGSEGTAVHGFGRRAAGSDGVPRLRPRLAVRTAGRRRETGFTRIGVSESALQRNPERARLRSSFLGVLRVGTVRVNRQRHKGSQEILGDRPDRGGKRWRI